MYQAPNDPNHWYVVEQQGKIKLFDNQPGTNTTIEFLDISDKVLGSDESGNWENGLLGLAFHPNFDSNGKLFVYYTAVLEPGNLATARGTLSSFIFDPLTQQVDHASEQILLQLPPNSKFHFGGTIGFGEDGYLYVSIGDNSIPGDAQDPTTLPGSILRLDVDSDSPYAIPPDNPFGSEIYSYGLRNPWKWSFDRSTGDIWLGDVGTSLWEEINIIRPGENYGWPIFQGFECFLGPCEMTGLTLPVFAYPHDEGCAITGGYVYRGSQVPQLNGTYIYGDFCTGHIWGLKPSTSGHFENFILLPDSGIAITSFAEDSAGELFILDYHGKVFKISAVKTSDQTGGPTKLLSQTGCFNPSDPKIPSEGLIPYSVNMPLWSDGAEKDRWMALPDGARIEIQEDGRWKFPVGTVLVKSFSLQDRLIETRLFMQHAQDEWSGYTYEWNDEQTEAFLVPSSGKTQFVAGQNWFFPGRNQCLRCHNAAAGHVLGLETPQMNRLFKYPSTGIESNQLLTLAHIGMFSNLSKDDLDAAALPSFPLWQDALPPPEKLSASARAYLHANCAICHRPGGPGFGPEDFRYFVPLQDIGACDVPPTVEDLDLNDPRLIKPGVPEESIVWARMNTAGPSRMPPLASFHVDAAGTETIAEWIRSLDSCEAE